MVIVISLHVPKVVLKLLKHIFGISIYRKKIERMPFIPNNIVFGLAHLVFRPWGIKLCLSKAKIMLRKCLNTNTSSSKKAHFNNKAIRAFKKTQKDIQ